MRSGSSADAAGARARQHAAPVGVGAVQRAAHEDVLADRAHGRARLAVVGRAADDVVREARGALAVGDHLARDVDQRARQRPAEGGGVGAARRHAAGAAREHDERVVGRLGAVHGHEVERRIGGVAQQSGQHGRLDDRIGGRGHDRRRHVGPDHARALAHHADAHVAAARARPSQCSSWPRRRSCGSRRRRPRRRSRRALPPRARCPGRPRPSAAACRSRRSSRRRPRRASMPSARAVALAIERASSRPWAPVQALALPELTTTARARPSARCSRDTSTGAAARRLCVNAPAAVASPSQASSARSGAPEALMPAGHAGGAEAQRKADAGALVGAHTPSPCAVSPAPSSRPSTRLAFWIACPAAPLTRLSIAAAQIAVCVRSSIQMPTWQLLAPCSRPGWTRCSTETNGSRVVARAVERVGLGLRERPAQPGVARHLETARVGGEVRRERDRRRPRPRAARASARSRRCGGGRSGLYGWTPPSTSLTCVRSVGSRPAPETPDLPSIATGASSSPASASGASASVAAVA